MECHFTKNIRVFLFYQNIRYKSERSPGARKMENYANKRDKQNRVEKTNCKKQHTCVRYGK